MKNEIAKHKPAAPRSPHPAPHPATAPANPAPPAARAALAGGLKHWTPWSWDRKHWKRRSVIISQAGNYCSGIHASIQRLREDFQRHRERQRAVGVPGRRDPGIRGERRSGGRASGVSGRPAVQTQGALGQRVAPARSGRAVEAGRLSAAGAGRGNERRPRKEGAARERGGGADRRSLFGWRHRAGAALYPASMSSARPNHRAKRRSPRITRAPCRSWRNP